MDYKIMKIDENNSLYIESSSGIWAVFNSTAEKIIQRHLQGKNITNIMNDLSEIYSLPAEIFIDDVNQCIEAFQKRLNTQRSLFEIANNIKADKFLTIHLTDTCNLHCPYCYRDSSILKESNDTLSVESIIKIINAALVEGFNKVIFSGGEPTLWRYFESLLHEIKKIKNVEFHIITNGTISLSDSVMKEICSIFKSIQISIDSYEESKNAITRGKGSLEKVIQFSNRLEKKGYKNFFYACTPFTHGMSYEPTIEDLTLMLRFSANMRSSGLYVNHLKPDGRQNNDDYNNFDEQEFWKNADKLYEEYFRLYNKGYNKETLHNDFKCFVAGDYIGLINNYTYKTGCGMGTNQLSIGSDGNVYPCNALMDSKLKLGNIHDDDFTEIIHSAREIYQNITVDTLDKCSECDFRLLCGGGCRAMAYYKNRDIMSCDPNCHFCKERIIKWLNVALLSSLQP